ncbi:MAG: hypothetical protein EBY40_13855 [Marivivens sp.]|nr:hypothetical protein [Marivivens sp.]NDH04183.1 hypothetical protein [Marivivens sp.]
MRSLFDIFLSMIYSKVVFLSRAPLLERCSVLRVLLIAISMGLIVVTLPMIRSEHAGLFTCFRDFADLEEGTRDGALPPARSRFV